MYVPNVSISTMAYYSSDYRRFRDGWGGRSEEEKSHMQHTYYFVQNLGAKDPYIKYKCVFCHSLITTSNVTSPPATGVY